MRKPTLVGELVRLRPVAARDADGLLEIVTDPESRRVTGQTAVLTRAEVDRWCETVSAIEGRIDLAVTAGGRDEYLGMIVLSEIDELRGSAELRLSMRPSSRGRGYGGEAIGLVLGLAFEGLGLHRVGCDVLSINSRALGVYQSVGFTVEGRLRDAYRDGAGYCDAIVLGLLEDEYRTLSRDL